VAAIGADRGIAHALSRHLHGRGDDVIAACFGDGADLAELGPAARRRFVTASITSSTGAA
jgi:2-glutathionyl-2-methylbut-3-en-1-ol dehydrogenase